MRRVLVAAAGAALLGLATGCSSDGVPGPDEPPAASAVEEAEPDVAEPLPPGPLEEYVGYAAAARTPEELVAEVARRENLTAACMAELGFEYEPQVPSVDEIQVSTGPEPGSREFVEAWGYGIWDAPPDGGGGSMSWTSSADPNWERREAMTEAGREAYDTALWGPITDTGEDGSVSREGGCSGIAEGWTVAHDAHLAGVRDEAQTFLETLGDDSRFADVDAAWASCMADGGFRFDRPASAQQAFMDEMLAETEDGVLDPHVAAERAPEEVRVAVADLDCQEATDWRARHREIEIELQQKYVDVHRVDLEALVAALEQAAGGT